MKMYLSFDASKKTSPVFGHQSSLLKAKIPVGILHLVLLQHLICCLTDVSHANAGCSVSVVESLGSTLGQIGIAMV